MGVFTIAFLDEPHTFTQEELRVLNLLADQSVIAVDNARLYRQLHEHAERLEERVRERTAQIEAHYAQLEAVLSSTTDGILVTDVEGQITRANTVASRWLSQGLSPEDADRLRETVRGLAQRVSEKPGALLELTGLDLELKAAPVAMPDGGEPMAADGCREARRTELSARSHLHGVIHRHIACHRVMGPGPSPAHTIALHKSS